MHWAGGASFIVLLFYTGLEGKQKWNHLCTSRAIVQMLHMRNSNDDVLWKVNLFSQTAHAHPVLQVKVVYIKTHIFEKPLLILYVLGYSSST